MAAGQESLAKRRNSKESSAVAHLAPEKRYYPSSIKDTYPCLYTVGLPVIRATLKIATAANFQRRVNARYRAGDDVGRNNSRFHGRAIFLASRFVFSLCESCVNNEHRRGENSSVNRLSWAKERPAPLSPIARTRDSERSERSEHHAFRGKFSKLTKGIDHRETSRRGNLPVLFPVRE